MSAATSITRLYPMTHRELSREAKRRGCSIARVAREAVQVWKRAKHSAAAPIQETTAQPEREMKPVDAGDETAQESVDAQACTSSQHKEGVGARDGLLRVVESTSQNNAAPSPQNQALVSPPSGAGH